MNDRVQELVEQADSTIYDQLDSNALDPFVKKFAELIIQECISAAEDAQADFYVINNIKARFGIKE